MQDLDLAVNGLFGGGHGWGIREVTGAGFGVLLDLVHEGGRELLVVGVEDAAIGAGGVGGDGCRAVGSASGGGVAGGLAGGFA